MVEKHGNVNQLKSNIQIEFIDLPKTIIMQNGDPKKKSPNLKSVTATVN